MLTVPFESKQVVSETILPIIIGLQSVPILKPITYLIAEKYS